MQALFNTSGDFHMEKTAGAQPDLGTQPCHKASGNFQVEIDKTQRLTLG